jgi:SAM-dependent methyltransferase
MTEYQTYFEYLKNRGRLGLLYRRFWLYPALTRRLNGKTLDVGCGLGDFLRFSPNSVGADINPVNVSWCRSQGLDVHLIDNGKLPFQAESFDSVVLDNVIEHITQPESLLLEIKRVIKTGGSLLIGVPGIRGYASDPDHKVYYDQDKLCQLLESFGFQKQEVFYMPLRFLNLGKYMRQHCLYGKFRDIRHQE